MVQITDVVPGLSDFVSLFDSDDARYVIIGGVARELIYRSFGQFDESGTSDIDVVLLAETLDRKFVARFLEYARAAGYRNVSRNETTQMYRFDKPAKLDYPKQIELLSRKADWLDGAEQVIGKVPVEDAPYSLSAILLNDEYYKLLSSGVAVTEEYGLRTLRTEYLIPFKMRAYIDIKANNGKQDEINKHRRDVFRLCTLLEPNTAVPLPTDVRRDATEFCETVDCPPNYMKSIGLGRISVEDIIAIIRNVYL